MKRLAVIALKILVSAALLWFLFHRIALAPMLADLQRVKPGRAALAVTLGAAQILLFAARWQRVGKACGAPLGWGSSLRLVFIGLFFNQTLPSSVGGDAMRVWLSVRMGVPAGRAFSSVAVDRFVALIVLLGLTLATLPLFYAAVKSPLLRQSLTALLVVSFAGFLFLLVFGSWLAAKLQAWRFTRPFGTVVADLRRVFLHPSGMVIVALSLAIHLASAAIVAVIASALGIALPWTDALVLVPPILLIMVIPITIAGWGLREGAMVVALAQIHIAAPDALAISILFGLLQILVSLPGAVLWLRRYDSLKIIARPGPPA